jgi:thiamine pyrophosphokinase
MGQSALILGNGEPPSRALMDECMRGDKLLLCADGGANTARRYGYAPDHIVGDMDSVSAEGKGDVPGERLIRVDADSTGTDIQ